MDGDQRYTPLYLHVSPLVILEGVESGIVRRVMTWRMVVKKSYLGADPEAFVAMSQVVIHLRGTNSTCSSNNETDAIAAITNANSTHSSIFGIDTVRRYSSAAR